MTNERPVRIGPAEQVETQASAEITAFERLELWNDALLERLLPVRGEPGEPVILACDDEAVAAALAELGVPRAEAVTRLATDIKIVFEIGPSAGLQKARLAGARFGTAPRPRPTPDFLAVSGPPLSGPARVS